MVLDLSDSETLIRLFGVLTLMLIGMAYGYSKGFREGKREGLVVAKSFQRVSENAR